jgi:RNA polymerase sigma-70 factor, ECF subfamily
LVSVTGVSPAGRGSVQCSFVVACGEAHCEKCIDRFQRLWASTSNSVVRSLQRRGAPPHLIDDLVAEVFLVAWRRLPDVPIGGVESTRWLLGVARRMYSNSRRSTIRGIRLAERLAANVTDQVGPHDRTATLEAWSTLSRGDRDILLMSGWQGLGLDEIARAMSCSTDAAAKRLTRARSRLAATLYA